VVPAALRKKSFHGHYEVELEREREAKGGEEK